MQDAFLTLTAHLHKPTDEFLGFCFAEYTEVTGVEAAVKMNGQNRLGRRLKIRYATDRKG